MCYELLNVAQGTPEWLKERLKRVTASQTPTLFDLSPYQTKLQLWEEKISGKTQEVDQNKAILFERGHAAERAAREWIKSNVGLALEPAVLISKAEPDLLASLDGFAPERKLIFEAKYVGRDRLHEIKKGKLPPEHDCQVQAQLFVSGAEKCLYFALDPDGEAAMVDVLPSENWLKEIPYAAKNFMELVRTGKAPKETDRDIRKVEDPRFITLAQLSRRLAEVKLQYNTLEEQILNDYSQMGRVQGGEVSITRFYSKGTVDYDKIPQLKGIDLERYRKTGSLRTRVTIRGEK